MLVLFDSGMGAFIEVILGDVYVVVLSGYIAAGPTFLLNYNIPLL